MSNWYVRRSRERFWANGMEQDKINAYMTLYTVLKNTILCAAPFIPFMTEQIYQNMVVSVDKEAKESVHLCDFPVADETKIDTELEKCMDEVLDIVILGRAARNTSGLKNRQPIGTMYVKAGRELADFYVEIIEDELNVKNVEFKDDVREFTSYTFKPQLKTVGPKYGRDLGAIKQYLAEINGNKAMDELNTAGALKFTAPSGTEVELTRDDLLIDVSQEGGYVTEENQNVTVVLDTNLDQELIDEGFMREIVSKIQTMRKEAGFEVMDHIVIYCQGTDKLKSVIGKYENSILGDCMANEINLDKLTGYEKDWDINGEKVRLGVEKVTN